MEKCSFHDDMIPEAYQDYQAGDTESAFLKYLFAAERGYEVAQLNAAWIIDSRTLSCSKRRTL